MDNRRWTVVKIGGSLLELADLPQRLHRWRSGRCDSRVIWIVGGGPAVDALRRRYRQKKIDNETAHHAAIDVMTANARALATRLPNMPFHRFDELAKLSSEPSATLLDVTDFMRQVEPGVAGRRLPVGWEATSDSIAGRLAVALAADHLVLLKSKLPGMATSPTIDQLAAAGYVDRFLPQLAPELPPLTVVGFRSQSPKSVGVATTRSCAGDVE